MVKHKKNGFNAPMVSILDKIFATVRKKCILSITSVCKIF